MEVGGCGDAGAWRFGRGAEVELGVWPEVALSGQSGGDGEGWVLDMTMRCEREHQAGMPLLKSKDMW